MTFKDVSNKVDFVKQENEILRLLERDRRF